MYECVICGLVWMSFGNIREKFITVTSTDCIKLMTFCGLSGAWTPMGVWMGFLLVVVDLQDQILNSKSFYISPVVSYLIFVLVLDQLGS